MMQEWGNGNWGGGSWLLMMIMMLIFLAVVVWAVVMFTHQWTSRPQFHDHSGQSPNAMRILDERFARGEINEEEYRMRRDILQKGQ